MSMQHFKFMVALFTVVSAIEAAEDKFEQFVRRFNRVYVSEEERASRKAIFTDNLKTIEAENAQHLSYTLGVNAFTDLTFEEFKTQNVPGLLCHHTHPFQGLPMLGTHQVEDDFLPPASVDWDSQGAVTPVLNQGGCGSCWSFSATGALEGAAVVAGRQLTPLSQQNLMDCILKPENKCNGGTMDVAFEYVQKSGLCAAADYPYKCAVAGSSECKLSQCQTTCQQVLKPGDITGYTDVPNSMVALQSALAKQPVSVGIEADKPAYQSYNGGVITQDTCGEQLDHGVLLVGYGVDNGTMYWKVKNSWGPGWGENGFVRIQRGKQGEDGGECGIRKMASYPTVRSAAEDAILV